MFRKRQDVKEADMDPGIDKMMELAKRQRMSARLPPREDVATALKQFFHYKDQNRQAINDNQAQLAFQSLRYCLAGTKEGEASGESPEVHLGYKLLARASQVLLFDTSPSSASALLAQELYEGCTALDMLAAGRKHAFTAYVYTLCKTGSAARAREVLLQYEQQFLLAKHEEGGNGVVPEEEEADDWPADVMEEPRPKLEEPGTMPSEVVRAWPTVLDGFVREENDAEVRQTYVMIEARGLQGRRDVTGTLLDFRVKRNDLAGVKQYWAAYLRLWNELQLREAERSPRLDKADALLGERLDKVLKWSLARNELDAGHGFVKEVMTTSPVKPVWDAIFVWAAGTKKSVDEIDRMMGVMEKSNESLADPSEWRVTDVATINGLVEFAIAKNDPYMAERFIALGKERNIEPDARTYVLQMDYRLSVEDVDGALIAYKNLQSMDLSSNEDVPTVNRLIIALRKTQRHDFDTIMNVAADLSDRRVRFEPDTVATLSLLHLNRDESHDVVDLLNTHAFHYSSAERERIRTDIVEYALNANTPTSRAWESYTILRSTFDELPRVPRTELMTSFFLTHRRPDMGVHVFQNMRAHSRVDTFPTVDTYVAAFMSLAQLRDLESLEVIHNLLKLDYNVDVTTYLSNALIIAYTACGKPRKALGFWDDIVASREGPSYNSIHVALRACEKSPFGDLRAQEIWAMLRRRGVEMDQALWASYVAALAGNGDNEMAISTLEKAVEGGECGVDAFLLGSLFAGAAGQGKQAEVEAWGKEHWPSQWGGFGGVGGGCG